MLIGNEHLQTRVRLIGPDGLPLVSTEAAAAAAESSTAMTSSTTSELWSAQYRIELVNRAASHTRRSILVGILFLGLL
ncbi:hypothetical protein IWW55_003594 [Coemansia sp. RSA 2706]|nr:hypothetical protein IWW55_003594 [Coemansia sp. RSA 2706]